MDTLECPPSSGEEMSEKLKRLLLRFNVSAQPRRRNDRPLSAAARKIRRREQGFTLSPGVNGLVVLTPPSKLKQADALGGRNVSGAPPGESAPSAPSTGTCLLLPSVRASPPPWRRRTDAARYHPA